MRKVSLVLLALVALSFVAGCDSGGVTESSALKKAEEIDKANKELDSKRERPLQPGEGPGS
jgi:hypothetical protein